MLTPQEMRDRRALAIANALISTRAQHRLDMIAAKAEDIFVVAYTMADAMGKVRALNTKVLSDRMHLITATSR